MFSIIRQLEEKNVANEIDILLWSDRMDLVAFSNIKGEVALHRLTWTRAWSLPPNKEGNLVRAMAWRPDGKVLAIGYSSGQVSLISVENKSPLYTIDNINGNITCLTWIKELNDNKNSKKLLAEKEDQKKYTEYVDYSSTFLPKPANLSNYSTPNANEENLTWNFFQDQTELNLLAIGTSDGFVYFRIFGCLTCATINISDQIGMVCSVIDIYLSENLSTAYVTVIDAERNIKLVVLNTNIFETHTKELFCIALKHQQIKTLVNYLAKTLLTIKETWESILLEMDSKLSKFASKTPEGTLSMDFLMLLMFGISTDEMQEFLLHDLTKKGLEKFGQTIEMSYANIQKLLLKNVTKMGQNITFHLAELRGMARLEHRYKILGLNEERITEAISANGSFLIKSGEMQQIINNSMLNYKAFFRWLYTAIIHLMEETVPPEIPKMTQQDLAYITEFLQNFDEISGENNTTIGGTEKRGFIMERLGQYLASTPLTILPNMELNEWDNFLMRNECVKNNPAIIKHYKEMSLVEQVHHLEDSLVDIFKEPHDLITKEIKLGPIVTCVNIPGDLSKVTSINSNNSLLYVYLPKKDLCDAFYFLELQKVGDVFTGKAAYVYISHSIKSDEVPGRFLITDAKFYTENVISLLLQENTATKFGVLFQCSCVLLREKLQPIDLNVDLSKQDLIHINAGDVAPNNMKNINMVASKFSVSGCRRVSVVLSENGKKVMLFEMEGEEEEEEDADMTNSTVRESDTSMQENSDAE